MLAHHAQYDAALLRRFDHGARRLDARGDGLLHLHVLFRLRAGLDRLQPEIGKRAHVHVIHLRVTAHLFVRLDELHSVLVGELPSGRLINIRANGEFVTYVAIRLGMFVRNGAGPDHSYSQSFPLLIGIMQYSDFVLFYLLSPAKKCRSDTLPAPRSCSPLVSPSLP